MGSVYADIKLINADDKALVRRNLMDKDEIRQMTVSMLVDSGAYNLCINEAIQAQLQLPFIEKRIAVTASGARKEFDIVGPVEIIFKNRKTICIAFVLPGDNEPLLGVIPMEDMDVIIHPLRQELLVNPEHPYIAQMKLK